VDLQDLVDPCGVLLGDGTAYREAVLVGDCWEAGGDELFELECL
jgi:hypothetical protein